MATMANNNMATNHTPEAWMRAFDGMVPKMRRWAFIAAKMAEKKKSFSDVARPNGRPSAWFISSCAQGNRAMTARVVKALEVELDIDLSPFLSHEESKKNQIKSHHGPEAWMLAFDEMFPKMRCWAFIAAKMAEKKKSFSDVARPNGRPTAWFISSCAQGDRPMTARVLKALEAELDIDLSPFLSPEESMEKEPVKVEEEPLSKPMKCECGAATLSFVDVIGKDGLVSSRPQCHKCWRKLRKGANASRNGGLIVGQNLIRFHNREYKPLGQLNWLFYLAEQ